MKIFAPHAPQRAIMSSGMPGRRWIVPHSWHAITSPAVLPPVGVRSSALALVKPIPNPHSHASDTTIRTGSPTSREGAAAVDWGLYRERNLVEQLVGPLKEYGRSATRYDKPAASYLAFVQLAAIRMWL